MWEIHENKLNKKFKFSNFLEAMEFINQVAKIANLLNHHPTLMNSYNMVEIWLCTHDQNNEITSKDHELAQKIDEIK
jgi:4a-hydroxytetrahydrobiopterin dehydratase